MSLNDVVQKIVQRYFQMIALFVFTKPRLTRITNNQFLLDAVVHTIDAREVTLYEIDLISFSLGLLVCLHHYFWQCTPNCVVLLRSDSNIIILDLLIINIIAVL